MSAKKIKFADYIGSFPSESKCPKDSKPEYAFIGRSNVGKSSLINSLCERKELARISKTPGKTQSLNYYLINNSWYIVDLPGYGYAKISKKKRFQWEKMIEGYLLKRANLQCAMVLIDACVTPQGVDIEFINWLGQAQIPFVIIYTKVDKLKPMQKAKNIKAFQDELHKYWNDLPQQFETSSVKRSGREEVLQFIEEINQQFVNE